MRATWKALCVTTGLLALNATTVWSQEGNQDTDAKLEKSVRDVEKSIEKWAGKWEKWSESQAVDWDKWGEKFGRDWEKWAEIHEKSWEDWAENYAAAWEEWGAQVEGGKIDEAELNRLFKRNLDMLGEMPLDQLYGSDHEECRAPQRDAAREHARRRVSSPRVGRASSRQSGGRAR